MSLVKLTPIFGVSAIAWWIFVSILQGLIAVLMFVAVFNNEWLQISLLKGSLLKVEHTSDGEDEGKTWHKFWNDLCDSKDDGPYCKTFHHLDIAGTVYGIVAVVSFLLLILWVIYEWRLIYGKQFLCAKPYAFIISLSAIHTISTVFWFYYANAIPGNACDEVKESNQTLKACPKDGAMIALALIVIIPVSGVIFLIIFSKINREIKQTIEDETSLMRMRRY